MSDKKILRKSDKWQMSGSVGISSSKSESNRLLLINALARKKMELKNLSTARDTQTMMGLLSGKNLLWDVKDAGTTMRFLTAFLALKGQNDVITGTKRMQQRPIGPLVNCLRLIGAEIEYLNTDGYPPLKINALKNQRVNQIDIPGNISSQYISALLMIAPVLPKGLTINLTTEIFSRPYIEMTLKLMEKYGVEHSWEGQSITIRHQLYIAQSGAYVVESDWSGASYWYSFLALGEGQLFLPNLRMDSTQGDRAIVEIMSKLGVNTQYESEGVRLTKRNDHKAEIELDFKECPDLAQTVMVVAAVKGTKLIMTGLESLKIKETDRVAALTNELAKIGASLSEAGSTWTLTPASALPNSVEIATYEDHRMAMAFAPLCCVMDVTIEEPDVVKKSYPEFWVEVKRVMS
jgi:3-phosphoshikimate 1-carboxyvinyltransferase